MLFKSCSYYTTFNPTTELVTLTGKPTKEAKAETETHPVTVRTKISKYSI